MVTLLSLFGKPKKRKNKRNNTSKLARLADITLATAIATDAGVERQWLELKYGINIKEENDPLSKIASEIRSKWTIEALEVLGDNDKNREAVIRELIDDIKKRHKVVERTRNENRQGKYQTTDGNAESGQKPEKRKNLRKEMIKLIMDREKKAGHLTDINSSKETNHFSEILQKLTAAAKADINSRTIAVEVDGKLVEMNPEAYAIFKKQREELLAARAKAKDQNQQARDEPHRK